MTSPYTPTLVSESDAPAVRSGLRSLFLFARVLRPRLAEVNRVPGALKRVIARFGESARDQFAMADPKTDLTRAWTHFFNHADIETLPAPVLRSFEEAQKESLELASTGGEFCVDLTAAHQKGHTLVQSILKDNGLNMVVEPAALQVLFDASSRHYCASVQPLKNRILWVYQPIVHNLYSALIAELVIAHEYLSHLVPGNPRLDKSIPEQWLNVALMEWFEQNGEPEMRGWMRRVWWFLRDALRDHVMLQLGTDSAKNQASLEGIFGVREFGISLYGKSAPTFWRLTNEILQLKDSRPVETEVSRLLEAMVADGAHWKNLLVESKWKKINDLYRYYGAS